MSDDLSIVSREVMRTLGVLTDIELATLREEALSRTRCHHCNMPVTAHGAQTLTCPPNGPSDRGPWPTFAPGTWP